MNKEHIKIIKTPNCT